MPFSPRPAIAFPAYQTQAGLTATAAREHQSDYAESQGQAQETNRRTDGVWTDLPYSPGRFTTGTTGATWQVQQKDVITARYKVIGAELAINLYIVGTLAGVPTGTLRIQLPERLRVRKAAYAALWGTSGAAFFTVLGQAVVGARAISFLRVDFQNWALGSAQVAGQMLIEVEEV